MAKDKVKCPFSNKLCQECALYRGRHMNLCYCRDYRGYLGVNRKPTVDASFEIPKKIAAKQFDPFEILIQERKGVMYNADRR
ncbi:MAG: hypothetical protein WBQ62_10505 [Dehalococcoidales bacterium]|jgi:hypothetical protein